MLDQCVNLEEKIMMEKKVDDAVALAQNLSSRHEFEAVKAFMALGDNTGVHIVELTSILWKHIGRLYGMMHENGLGRTCKKMSEELYAKWDAMRNIDTKAGLIEYSERMDTRKVVKTTSGEDALETPQKGKRPTGTNIRATNKAPSSDMAQGD